jgi:predicted phage terminase large subunit-like protein
MLPDLTKLSPEQFEQLRLSTEADKARRSLREFVKQAYLILEPQTQYKESIIGAAISEHLEAVSKGQIKRLAISAPPQMGKSNIASVCWAMWDWIDTPHRRYLCTSFKNDLAEHFSEEAMRLFKSDWYQQMFAGPRQITLTKETIQVFENAQTGSRRMSAYESATGFGVAGGVLVCDDPHPVGASEDVLNAQVEMFHKVLSNRPGATGSIVVLGQRVATNDLIGTLSDMGSWETLVLPNEYDPKRSKVTSIGWKDPRTEEGELIWPEVFDEKRTKEAKRYGRTHYEGQYNQTPIKKGGNIFNRADFRTYTQDTLPKEYDQIVISVDTSFKDTKHSDFVVVQAWQRTGANFYLLDQDRAQADFTRTIQMFLSMVKKYPRATAKYIEESSNGFAIIASLRNRIPGIIAVKVRNESKLSRYNAVAPLVAAHNVYLPAWADWLEDFLIEAESVPQGRHDDQMDAMAMALTKLELSQPFKDVFGVHMLVG